MGDFVELGAEGVNWLTEKYFERGYDAVQDPDGRVQRTKEKVLQRDDTDKRKRRNTLPPPEEEREETVVDVDDRRTERRRGTNVADSRRDPSLERQSETSERVLRAYESERDDPRRKAESVLSRQDLRKLRRDNGMSYANGYAPSAANDGGRPRSQQPPKSRYGDEDDWDEHRGEQRGSTAQGWDDRDRDYDDRPYTREVIETERYRGPARDYGRGDSYGTNRDPYDAGAVTKYQSRRSQNDVSEYQSRRSRSRGRRDGGRRDDRDRSYSDSRSRSRSRDEGFRGKLEDHFDTSAKGLGVGIAGAVIGGLAGREFGHKHKNRDIVLGALIGGLGANAAENKWRDWREDKKEKLDREEEKWDQRYDGGNGRSRSAMR